MDLRRSFTTAAAGLLVAVPVALLPGTGGPSPGDESSLSTGPGNEKDTASGGDARGLEGDDGPASLHLRAPGGPSGSHRHNPNDASGNLDDTDGAQDDPSGPSEGNGPVEADPSSDTGSEEGSADAGKDPGPQDDGPEDGSHEGPDGSPDNDPAAHAHAGIRGGVEA